MATTEEILNQLLSLPVDTRARVAQRLLESLESADDTNRRLWDAEIESRLDAYEPLGDDDGEEEDEVTGGEVEKPREGEESTEEVAEATANEEPKVIASVPEEKEVKSEDYLKSELKLDGDKIVDSDLYVSLGTAKKHSLILNPNAETAS